jgi:cytochrome c biogenesis protein CcmG/thiol:disulfide interchange protein DsbE
MPSEQSRPPSRCPRPQHRPTTRIGWVYRTLILYCACVSAFVWVSAARAHVSVGQSAPPLILHTLDGREIATQQLRGKVVVLTFWATWCTPCRTELPVLSAYATLHAADGLQVLGFSLDDPENLSAVRRVASTLSFPVGLLGGAWAGDYGRIWRLPVSFTIDRSGVVVDNTWDDPVPVWTQARLERVVTPLLQKSP